MKVEDFLSNLNQEEEVKEEAEAEAPEEESELLRVMSDTSSVFRGKITKPVMMVIKYKDLALKLKEGLGLPMTRDRAKMVFDIVKSEMGL